MDSLSTVPKIKDLMKKRVLSTFINNHITFTKDEIESFDSMPNEELSATLVNSYMRTVFGKDKENVKGELI